MQSGTFSSQQSLPNLEIPSIEETIERYLKSVSVVVSAEKLDEITKLTNSFKISPDYKLLQDFLLMKAENEKNWLESWWYDAYTANRESLITQNMGGIIPKIETKHSQITVAASMIYHMMSYWTLVRQEKIEITKSRGVTWDMDQVYNLFNASRIPELPIDRIVRFFKTESEGTCPSHVVILCNGNIWKLNVLNSDGSVKPIPAIVKALELIKKKSAKQNYQSIVPLTTLARDEWAKIRNSIETNSKHNTNNFGVIDSAVFSLTLSDDIVEKESQLMKYSLFGSAFNSYCDKNLNLIVLRDGRACLQAEHGNVDAISLFAPCDYAADKLNNQIMSESHNDFCVVEELKFQTTADLSKIVNEAEKKFEIVANKYNVEVFHYTNFASLYCKKQKIYADTIIQIALQLAYFKTHRKLAPTYETASTRKFYHGRTETVRSLTPAVAKFILAVDIGATNDVTRTLFFDAYNAHNTLMDFAREGKGIDRHLFGLKMAEICLADLNIKTSISFLEDESFSKSGGNGNFKLSTSLLGYSENGVFGFVTPMCVDGYGSFYRINNDRFSFTLTSSQQDGTDIKMFRENLESTLNFIKNKILPSD